MFVILGGGGIFDLADMHLQIDLSVFGFVFSYLAPPTDPDFGAPPTTRKEGITFVAHSVVWTPQVTRVQGTAWACVLRCGVNRKQGFYQITTQVSKKIEFFFSKTRHVTNFSVHQRCKLITVASTTTSVEAFSMTAAA